MVSSRGPRRVRILCPASRLITLCNRRNRSVCVFQRRREDVADNRSGCNCFSIASYIVVPRTSRVRTALHCGGDALEDATASCSLSAIRRERTRMCRVALIFTLSLAPSGPSSGLNGSRRDMHFIHIRNSIILSYRGGLCGFHHVIFGASDSRLSLSRLLSSNRLLTVCTSVCCGNSVSCRGAPCKALYLCSFGSRSVPMGLSGGSVTSLARWIEDRLWGTRATGVAEEERDGSGGLRAHILQQALTTTTYYNSA